MAFQNKEDNEYSRDLFGGYYKKNFDVFGTPQDSQSRFGQLKVRNDAADRSSDDIGSTSTSSIPYSPSRRTPTHKKSVDINFDSPNPSLATINQKTNNNTSQSTQPLWFNNPKRRTVPSRAIKRETYDEIEPETNFLSSSASKQNSPKQGFKTLTFGTRRNNTELTHVNTFSDELPPMKTISDLQREDDSDSFLSFNQTNGNMSLLSPSQAEGATSTNGTPSIPHIKNLQGTSSGFSTPLKKVESFASPQSATQPSPQRTQGGESAVLVFGYPESIANSVIKHFGKFGRILEDFEATRVDPLFLKQSTKSYPIFTGDGWVKLTYDNRASAIRALEESGSVFHGTMIGCVPYSKSAVENIASINIQNNEDIGESDIHVHQSTDAQQSDCKLNLSTHPQRLTLKNDDKIFMKPQKETANLYSSRAAQDQKPVNNSLLGKVNNWLFGWEDL
ncbi:Nucleoporin NUP53 [Cyberlindnera fabianii]|uniref:Nucleoporin NUP53 n=1 Tax=Cyberlindnera fabianii TaxID=36022 RepID=A0A1V2L7K5_CYBFA|nr:Nucleoporin NUP53 [Cyberlindnera fabianii]